MPDYTTNDPRGWCGDPRRGASMGRADIREASPDFAGKLVLRKIRMNGDYDSLGTYWGYSPGTAIYWCADAEGQIDFCVRATSREDAKRQVQAHYPRARFYR